MVYNGVSHNLWYNRFMPRIIRINKGRYKSFICQKDDYFFNLVRYVESNAKKANLCRFAEDWQWSSIYRREKGSTKQKEILSKWPIDIPNDYLSLVNQYQDINEEKIIENSIAKSNPYGDIDWVKKVVKDFGLEQTLRRVGRPKNGG